MTERRVSVRLGIVGGKEVEATFEQLGTRGSAAMKRIGDSSEQAFDRVRTASGRGGFALQNVGFQVQDFAVQVGAGTSATQALAQQLPQLLSGLGLLGVILGTTAAIAIPIAGYFFNMGEEAEAASSKIETLVTNVQALQEINKNFSTEGVQKLIDKYGELDAAVVLLVSRQQKLAEDQAVSAARDVATGFGTEFAGLFAYLDEYESRLAQIKTATGADEEAAQSFGAIKDSVQFLNDEYGITFDRVREIQAALEALSSANSVPEMAAATADLSGLLEGSSLASSDLAGELLKAEDQLRQLNKEGAGIGGWLGAAIGWAGALGGRLWDAAAAAAAIRAAAPGPGSANYDATAARTGLAGPDGVRAEMNGGGRFAAPVLGAGLAAPVFRGSAGGGSATNELEREAQRIFESTRSEAEQYATELARLEEIKAAGLITGDTYNRQLDALAVKYNQQGDALAGLQEKLADFAAGTKNIAVGIGDAIVDAFESGSDAVADFVKTGKLDFSSLITSFLADMAKLAAQKYIFGPLAGMLSGALGGAGGLLANVLHEGGNVGGSGTRRSVPVAAFAGAPRFHNGVNLGLASDELPAILQRGERVLSRAENKAYGRQQGPMVVNFNVKDAASMRQSRAQMAADAQRIVGAGARNR